jgi:acyl carrier protein
MIQDDALRERIWRVLRDALQIEVPAYDTDLIDGGLLDSLALVSLIGEIELDFSFQLPLDEVDVESFRSIERIAELVASRSPSEQAA